IIFSTFVLICLFILNSCKKCSICTFEDPQKGTITSDDVCQKGNAYDQTMKQYKDGWSCQKKL
ncbi:MAG: hypothetical protein ACKVJP_05125, partial [Flavobacteriales bacterium]